ncbi:hypothetical protein PFISCL1PPCAC_2798, partial [Pristionchus fissidentatus]
RANDAARTTRMLIGIACLTLISELPQGLLNIANSFLSITFKVFISDKTGPLFALIQVIATTCNLLVYLAMSSKFRE